MAVPGGTDAYGFVKYDVSDAYDGIGSRRRSACLALARLVGERRALPLPSVGDSGDGVTVAVGMLVWLIGGLLWKRQKMWKKLASSFAAITCSSEVNWP